MGYVERGGAEIIRDDSKTSLNIPFRIVLTYKSYKHFIYFNIKLNQ